MRMLRVAGLVVATAAALAVGNGAAQVRGLLGVGLGVPVGDFASTNDGGNAEAGGGTGLLGVEWLPEGRTLGLRVDGAYNRFCTSACNDAGGNLDQRYRFLNANLNGLLEVALGNSAFRPMKSQRDEGSARKPPDLQRCATDRASLQPSIPSKSVFRPFALVTFIWASK